MGGFYRAGFAAALPAVSLTLPGQGSIVGFRRSGMRLLAGVAVVACGIVVPRGVVADEVWLKGGGRLVGEVVQRTATQLMLEVGPGHVSVPLSRVERVVAGPSPLSVYRSRATRLGRDDLAGWLDLAAWAEEHDLGSQSRDAYAHVLTLDPGNAAAHRALGHVLVGGSWMPLDESYRARGYVLFEGTWMLPEERAAVLRERAESAVAVQARAEAEARAREAEARARAAEAEARRAELELAQASADPYDIGLGPVFGPYLGAFPGVVIGAPGLPNCPPKPRSFVVVHRNRKAVAGESRHRHRRGRN